MSTSMFKREFRVIWQVDKGDARHKRIYQDETRARKFFQNLSDSYRLKRFESRVVEEWELMRITRRGESTSYEK